MWPREGDRVQVPPATQHRRGILDPEEELDDMGLVGARMQPELELGHDAEVAAEREPAAGRLQRAPDSMDTPMSLGIARARVAVRSGWRYGVTLLANRASARARSNST
jgi:hypothetical protein